MFKFLRYKPIYKIFYTAKYEYGCSRFNRELDLDKLEKEPPRTIGLEVTDVCSANCVFCAYRFTEPKGPMPTRIFRKAIEQYREMGGKAVYFSPLVGDPLCDPFLFERIKIVTSVGMKVGFHTNAILLKGKVDKLVDSGVDHITLSMASFDRGMFYRMFRSNGGSYEAYIDSILELLKANRRRGNPIKINIMFRVDRLDALPGSDFGRVVSVTSKDFRERNIDFDIGFDDWCGQIEDRYFVGDMKLIPRPRRRRVPCGATFYPYIMRDGSVRACGCRFSDGGKYDELVYGSLEKNTLRELWHGERIREIWRSFVNLNPPNTCKKCLAYSPGVKKEMGLSP